MTVDKRLGVVRVIGLKGLAESKEQPSTMYALGKYIPHFGSVVGIGPSTKSQSKRPEGDGLVSNKVYFKI